MEVKEKKYYPINFRVKNWRKKNSFQSNRFEYDNRGSANGAAGLFFYYIWLVFVVVVVFTHTNTHINTDSVGLF